MTNHTRRSFIGAAGLALGGTALSTKGLSRTDAAAEAASQPESDWPMLGRDPQRTGFNPQGVSLADLPLVDWSWHVTDLGLDPTADMDVRQAVADGTVYLGGRAEFEDDARGVVAAVDLDDGETRWRTELEEPASYPAVGGESIYVTSRGRLVALSRVDGAVRWSEQVSEQPLSVPTVADGTVYVSTTGSADPPSTYALDAATGEQQWRADIGGHSELIFRPAVDGDMVFVGRTALSAADGSVVWGEAGDVAQPSMVAGDAVIVTSSNGGVTALDRADGSVRWGAGIEGPDIQLPTAAPALHDDLVIVPTYAQVGSGGRVTALNLSDGSVAWSIDPGSGAPGSVASGDGVVYLPVGSVTSEDGSLWALDPEDGSVRWRFPMRGPAIKVGIEIRSDSAAAPVSDTVVLTDGDGYAYTLTGSDPAVAWRFDAAGPVRSSPAVADSTVFAGDETGAFYAIDIEAGETRWQTQGATGELGIVAAGDRVITIKDGLSAFDVQTGDVDWQIDAGGYLAPTVADGAVYAAIPGARTEIRAIDAETGDVRWLFTGAEACPAGRSRLAAPPIVSGDRVYVGESSPEAERIWAVNRSDGSLAWVKDPGANLRSIAVTADTVFYGQGPDSDIHALSAADGSEQQGIDLDDSLSTSHDVRSLTAEGDSVYATSIERHDPETGDPVSTGYLHAIDSDGTRRWSLAIDSSSEPAVDPDPVVADGTVFATGDRRLYAVNAADGSVVERFETGGPIHSTPAVAGDSAFVGSDDAFLYRFRRS